MPCIVGTCVSAHSITAHAMIMPVCLVQLDTCKSGQNQARSGLQTNSAVIAVIG